MSNDTSKRNLYPPDYWRVMLRRGAANATRMHDLVVKFAFSMQFFLESTSSRWFFRGTDDTIINFRALGPFMTDLEQRYDPQTDFVFLANCVRLGERLFPQGGSGYFMSRRAVEVMAPLGEQILRSIIDCEDYDLGRFMLNRMNFSLADMTSGALIGHSFNIKRDMPRIRSGKWDEFPPCPPMAKRSAKFCRPFFARMRDIVFYHEWRPDFPACYEKAEKVFNAPPNIYWYVEAMWPVVCRLDV
jgi:hypothetical protein